MEQNASETDSSSANREITAFNGTLVVHYHVHRRPKHISTGLYNYSSHLFSSFSIFLSEIGRIKYVGIVNSDNNDLTVQFL